MLRAALVLGALLRSSSSSRSYPAPIEGVCFEDGPLARDTAPRFPPHFYYTGRTDSNMKHLVGFAPRTDARSKVPLKAGVGYPDWLEFHYFDDEDLAVSMVRLDQALVDHANVTGALAAFDALAPFAFKVDLWRYAMLWACGGVYADSKMRLVTDFGAWVERHVKVAPTKSQVVTCVDMIGTKLDPRGETAVWQGFLLATPRSPRLLWAIEYAIANVKRRYYPHEGVLSMLYVTGPGALGRAAATRNRFYRDPVADLGLWSPGECQWGGHGHDLRGNPRNRDFYTLDPALHKSMRGGNANTYGDLFKRRQAYGEVWNEARYPYPLERSVAPYFYLLETRYAEPAGKKERVASTSCADDGRYIDGDRGSTCADYGCDAFGCGEAIGGVHLRAPENASGATAAGSLLVKVFGTVSIVAAAADQKPPPSRTAAAAAKPPPYLTAARPRPLIERNAESVLVSHLTHDQVDEVAAAVEKALVVERSRRLAACAVIRGHPEYAALADCPRPRRRRRARGR